MYLNGKAFHVLHYSCVMYRHANHYWHPYILLHKVSSEINVIINELKLSIICSFVTNKFSTERKVALDPFFRKIFHLIYLSFMGGEQ